MCSINCSGVDTADGYLFPSAGRWLRFGCYLVDYLIIGYDILKKASLNNHTVNRHFLSRLDNNHAANPYFIRVYLL